MRKVYAMDDATYSEIVDLAVWDGAKAACEALELEGLVTKPISELKKPQLFNLFKVGHKATEESLKQRIKDWTDTTGRGENG